MQKAVQRQSSITREGQMRACKGSVCLTDRLFWTNRFVSAVRITSTTPAQKCDFIHFIALHARISINLCFLCYRRALWYAELYIKGQNNQVCAVPSEILKISQSERLLPIQLVGQLWDPDDAGCHRNLFQDKVRCYCRCHPLWRPSNTAVMTPLYSLVRSDQRIFTRLQILIDVIISHLLKRMI